MKLAVVMATYWRKNNKSKEYLLKIFNVLNNQECQDFKLFLIGDNYEKKDEFNEICSSYSGNIYYENSPIDFRSGYFQNNRNKWTCGGVNATYLGVKRAIEQGYEYYIHLDDDDYWEPNHISEIVSTITNFPEVDFIISKSKYSNTILPREHASITKKGYNNWSPKPCNSVHSSWCINLKTLGNTTIDIFEKRLMLVNDIKDRKKKETQIYPFDAHCLKIYGNLHKTGKIKCICIEKITCKKYGEGHIPQ